MRVLIATNELQSASSGDYSHTVEGELVTPVVAECADPDRCGCARGFPGLASARATTTAMVVDRPFIGIADLRDAVRSWLERGGWADLLSAGAEPDEVEGMLDEIVDEHVDAIDEVCAAFPLGTVVERHGTLLAARVVRGAA